LTVEARRDDGSVISQQTLDVGGIPSGGEKQVMMFKEVGEDQAEAFKNAEFKVVWVSQY
jgi:hypothetical protein